RIGNNSYYACVGGANPMRALVADLVDGTDEVHRISENGLYTRARPALVRRYLTDEALRSEFDQIVRARKVANPMRYPADTLRARLVGKAMELNYDRKFARYYPKPTDTSF
ncbi:MAG: ATP-grasp domain-containing protein, partial [Atopobiaceae bacterium]|nr:ATP-grasp domain-containing protein [Atopobiaceae bacterium]